MIHDFRTRPWARLTAVADFRHAPVLNIDFLDANGARIPFHLSLRGAEGVAVVNRRVPQGWRREVAFPFAPQGPVAVDIRFGPLGAVVRLDGRCLGRFDALPRLDRGGRLGLRHGFPGLGAVARVRLDGALVPGSLRLTCPGLPRPSKGPHLTDRLTVEWADPPAGARDAVLTAPGLAAAPRAVLHLGPHTTPNGSPRATLVALVPGRVWGAGQVDLTLGPGPGIPLDRAGLVARLTRAADAGLWDRDDTAALLALEHLRYAGVWDQLAPRVQAALARQAQARGLAGWALPDAPPPPSPPPDPAAPHRAAMAAAFAAGGDALGVLGTALADPALDPRHRQGLLRGAVEGAVRAGQIGALQALARPHLPLSERDDAWSLSTALPFDLAQGWFGAVADRLRRLPTAPGWCVTPAVAWAVGQVAQGAPDPDGRTPSAVERAAATRAFADYLWVLADDPAGRGPCTDLMAVARALVADGAPAVAASATRLWGLTPAFWAGFGSAGPPPPLRPAASLCADLVRAVQGGADPAHLAALLTQAQAMGIADTARWRREVLPPLADPNALARMGADPDDGCLRALAHPDAPAQPTPQTLAAADRGARAAYADVPQVPQDGVERRLLARALALLADPESMALARWATDLGALDDADGAACALALGLAAGLARGGQGAAALIDALPFLAQGEGAALALARLARHDPALADRAARRLRLAPPPAPTPCALMDGADPLHHTLVAVYSARAHLDTRLPHLRATWLNDLSRLGIPWLVFTGGGNGARVGDTVALDAPDDYEGLPDKTLAMVRWVLGNTRASRLLKVDDDCYVHAPAMFGDLALLRHPYVGRPLTRGPGQLDRTWHMAKSASPRGRGELDKSPEPSAYADGGSGYALSRGAMQVLVDMADSPAGQALRQGSFLEDKLVGDLLAMAGIPLSGAGWRVAIRRRPAPDQPPRPAWEDAPLPWAGAPIRLAHLDDAGAMAQAAAAARAPAPAPGTLWPTTGPVRLGRDANALHQISPPARLAQVRRAPVAVVACVRNEAAMLPLFLDHYRRLGVGAFLIADNGSTDGTTAILEGAPDVAAFWAPTDYNRSMFGVAWQHALLAQMRLGQWSLVADADEFLVLPEGAGDLAEFVAAPGLARADAVRLLMLDLYPKGPLSAVTLASGDPFAETGWADRQAFLRTSPARGPFGDAETVTSGLRHRLMPGSRPELFVAQKMALLRYRPWMRLSAGLHYVAGVQAARGDLLLAHVKYTATFRAKVQAEARRGQHFNGAEEYRRYHALMAEGQEVLWDASLSVPWRAVPEVQRMLSG